MPGAPVARASKPAADFLYLIPGSSLFLFSSDIERDAAYPDGLPNGIPTAVCGIGLIDAAAGTARIVERERPAFVVFVGTCGAHVGAGISEGDLVLATGAVLSSGDVARGQMRLPALMAAEEPADAGLNAVVNARCLARGIRLRPARVACALGITEDAALAGVLAASGEVENMEAFAVLRAARGIPATAVLGVTNIVGPFGGRAWFAGYRAMMRTLATDVVQLLQEIP